MPEDSFESAIADLASIRDVCRASADRNGYFAAMYGRVTVAVTERARAGRFADADRMERFVAVFARRYTDAFQARTAKRPTTRSWAVAFDAAEQSGPLVLQHLMLGMNAHINLDLGIVAAELGRADGSLDALKGDFDAINSVLVELTDRCQAAVVSASPVLALADEVLDQRDEDLARFSLRVARDGAWKAAEHLYAASEDQWPALVAARDESVANLGSRLLTSAGPADFVQGLLRATEWHSVTEIIDRLAAVDVS